MSRWAFLCSWGDELAMNKKGKKMKLTWANENENWSCHQSVSHVYFKLTKTNGRTNSAQF